MIKKLLQIINKQHSNDHSLIGAIEEIMRPNANSITRDEWQPFHRFPDVKHVKVEVKPMDRLFELFGIKRRSGPATIHYMKYKNKPINRFALRQIKRLRAADDKTFWRMVGHLLKRSNVFFMLALYHVYPRWHRDLRFWEVINLHRKFRKISKDPQQIDYKRVYIPKANGKWRPLGVPKPEWRLYLHLLNQFLVLRFNDRISDNQHGFRPGRGTLTAWKEILLNHSRYRYIYEMDYKKFFDSLNQSMISETLLLHYKVPREWWTLIEKLNMSQPSLPNIRQMEEKDIENNKILIKQGIRDSYVWLNEKWKKVGFAGNHTLYGIPQGAPTSPFLSILLLDYVTKKDAAYPDTKWVRYADDVIVMMNEPIDLVNDQPDDNDAPLFLKRTVLERMKSAGIEYAKEKCDWVKWDGKWLKPLKFLGLEFDGQTLKAKTRKGSELLFDKHNLVMDYLAREWKTTPSPFSWSYLARSDIMGFFQARLYQGDYNLKNYSQDFRLKFTPGSWTDHYFKWIEKLERGADHMRFLAKLSGIHLTVFNSTSLCLQSGLEAIKEAEKTNYKKWPEGPLYEMNSRKQIEWHFRNAIRDAREAGNIEQVEIIGDQWKRWGLEQTSKEQENRDLNLREKMRKLLEDTSITTVDQFLKVTDFVPTKGTYPKINRGISKRYHSTMIRPEVNRHAFERLKNILLVLGWGSLGVMISIVMITYLSENPIQVVEEVPTSNDSKPSSWIPLALMLGGIIMMIGIHIWLDQEPTHWAERLSQGYSGPLTSVEMVELKSKLAVQALADNLAISPIGDLWQSPW